ncbi:MAG: winged helix-turn-helix transcriptional regulator, partial [Clostridiales bacterium]|nr:winged helix-turn-helix transcriptional regulator [Clostridiales bacterium]
MNIAECNILMELQRSGSTSQRALARAVGHSLGVVNRSLKALHEAGYTDDGCRPTEKAAAEFRARQPRQAVILAAGAGMRMIPLNMEVSKGLLEVNGEVLIERLIRQLQEVGIRKIYVVVGFMKEKYEYLMDAYGVELIVNPEYALKNNLHSLYLAREHLTNAYVIPCGIWCSHNPFSREELYSWYMVTDRFDLDSSVRVSHKGELMAVPKGTAGNSMIGICYLTQPDSDTVCTRLEAMDAEPRYDDVFWEETLRDKGRMIVPARLMDSGEAVSIKTFEQLRELGSQSDHLKSEAIRTICDALHADMEEITQVTVLKKGMTNRSFLFSCKGKRYIMRIPGEGTAQLVDRRHEAAVYQAIREKNICDDIAYISPDNGYKITEYLADARVCNPEKAEDVRRCMQRLREFHELRLTVAHTFDIFGQIEFYESLWNGAPSIYKDYRQTKENVFSLRGYIDAHVQERVLTHIDAVPDNFLFVKRDDGSEEIRLIDWEYAGMQDPHVDIAMFCIYALYDRRQVDETIAAYFPGGCSEAVRLKIYCYIAACGLLWSNWCEYKWTLGVEFGEYSLRQ